jgi:hypothetical protein
VDRPLTGGSVAAGRDIKLTSKSVLACCSGVFGSACAATNSTRSSSRSGGQTAEVIAVAGPLVVVRDVAIDAAGDGQELVGRGVLKVSEALPRLAYVQEARIRPVLAGGRD